MKKLLAVICLLCILPIYAADKDKYGIPLCKNSTDYNCRVQNNKDGLYWYQVIEQYYADNGKRFDNRIETIGCEYPYQSYEKLCYDYRIETIEQAKAKEQEELEQIRLEQEKWDKILGVKKESDKKEVINPSQKFIDNNKIKPTKPYTNQEQNLQWQLDPCLRNPLACIENAFIIAGGPDGWWGKETAKRGYIDAVGNEKLYNEIFYFYAIKYRERWKNGYYIEANPILWQYGRPN